MNLSKQIARHFHELYFGPNWIASSMKEKLEGIDWQQATTSVYEMNTIALLVFHLNYYVSAVLKVLQGGPLDAHDKFSFDMPPIESEADWDRLKDKTWADAELFARLVEQMSEDQLWQDMADSKYGSWYRNLQAMIEHSHYHLGQIALIRKLLLAENANS